MGETASGRAKPAGGAYPNATSLSASAEMPLPMASTGVAPARRLERVGQLLIGIVCMAMIANLQYGWTLFVNPIQKTHGWPTAEIQLAFSIFVALETWLTPVQGWIVDSLGARGPRLMVAAGGVLVGIGWALNSIASSLT